MKSIPDAELISKASRENIDVVVVSEAIRIIKNRHRFKKTAFRRWLRESEWLYILPDEVTPEWVHGAALSIVDDFVRDAHASASKFETVN